MGLRPRHSVERTEPDQHGGLREDRLRAMGVDPAAVIDFSVNVNPFPPPPEVLEAIHQAVWTRYPDPEATLLREAVARRDGVLPDQVLAVNGTIQAIYLLAWAYLRPNDVSIVLTPTFGEYRVASELAGASVVTCLADAEDGFQWEIESIVRCIRRLRPRVVWLCNPNNPTGVYLDRHEVSHLLEACVEAGALMVLDEAYRQFVSDPWDSAALIESGHLALLRSMTKDYALVGLRLGYVVATSEIVSVLRKVQPPWSVNALAQAAGRAALEQEAYYHRMWEHLRECADSFWEDLRAAGACVLSSQTTFALIEVGDGASAYRAFLKEGLLVRDCASFGLPGHIRVATRLPEENARFLAGWLRLGRRFALA